MSNTPDQRVVCSRCNGWGLIGDGHNTLGADCPGCSGSDLAAQMADQKIDDLLNEFAENVIYLRDYRVNTNWLDDDVEGWIHGKRNELVANLVPQLKSLVETMAKDIVDAGPTNGTAMEVRAEQRQRIPQVISKYFGGGE